MKNRVLLGLALAALSLPAVPSRAQEPSPARYSITDLGTLPGGNFSQATYISNSGVITGISTAVDGSQHAVVWNSGHIIDLGSHGIGGPNSGALGVNAKLQAAGWAESGVIDPNHENFCDYFTGLNCLPVLWKGGAPTILPLLGGNNGAAGPLNVRGEAVGFAENAVADWQCPGTVRANGTGPQVLDFQAVIWGPSVGQKRQLSALPGDTVSEGIWINDLGQAVGVSGLCSNTAIPPFVAGPHAVLWDVNGTARDLGNLGGTANPNLLGIGNAALAINNRTQITGASALADNTHNHAFLWTKESNKMQDLGTLEGDVNSAGLAINNRGDIVGDSLDGDLATGNIRPFLWQNGTMKDLNSLVPADTSMYLLGVFGINDVGQIVGFGLNLTTFEVHAFVANPNSMGSPASGHAALNLPTDVRSKLSKSLARF